jgi:DUF1680 family protein
MRSRTIIEQQNNYPWDGNLKFIVSLKSSDAFNLMIRIPGWAQNTVLPSDLYSFVVDGNSKVEIKINGQPIEYRVQKGYAVLNRKWKKGDVVEVNLPMETKLVKANENLKDDVGKVAVERGPLVYCAEWKDNDGKAANIVMPLSANFTPEFKNGILNGVEVLKTTAPVIEISKEGTSLATVNKTVTLIPYYAWANRGEGEMMIWFPSTIKDVDLIAKDEIGQAKSK